MNARFDLMNKLKDDLKRRLIDTINEECVSDFEKLIKQECARDLKVRVIIDTNNMLDEKNNNRFCLKQFFVSFFFKHRRSCFDLPLR